MKKMIAAALAALTVFAFSGCGNSGADAKVLKVYNAGEYMEMSLKTKFEKEYNCKVVYETFDSNESMYTKLQSGEKYDVLIPSDYMIERLIKEDYLAPIDWEQIPNKDAIIPEILNKEYDPENKYAVPYFWGNVGILYDTEVVDSEDLKDGWELLKNEKYAGNIYMYDSERDSFMIALKALGYSMNTDDKAQLDEAYEWLVDQKDKMDPVYVGDEVIDNMISGNKAMAVVYSGDGAYIMTENDKLDYFNPEEGTNIWYDAMVITKDCENTELAHQFINFMLEEDNALANTETVGYSSSVKSVYEEMSDTLYKDIGAYVPRVGYELDESFKYQTTEIKRYGAELWTKVKSR